MARTNDNNLPAEKQKEQFLFNAAVQFSTEFWTRLYAISCDQDLLRSVYSAIGKKHLAGDDEEALDLLYAMNLFSEVEMALPIAEITRCKTDISVFIEFFLWAAEDDIDDVEDDPAVF
ncbi:MAG: hypothetical protein EOM48_10770 [Bacilli bacterium]|nr:hypothetical protein [Bacilli bacterium]